MGSNPPLSVYAATPPGKRDESTLYPGVGPCRGTRAGAQRNAQRVAAAGRDVASTGPPTRRGPWPERRPRPPGQRHVDGGPRCDAAADARSGSGRVYSLTIRGRRFPDGGAFAAHGSKRADVRVRNARVWRRSCSVGTFDLAVQYQCHLVAGDGQAHVWLMSESGEEREVGGESCRASSGVRREFRLAGARPGRGPRGNVAEIGQVSGQPGELAEPAVGEDGRTHADGGERSSRSRPANSSSSQILAHFFSMRGSTS